jgi:hypothetical protein
MKSFSICIFPPNISRMIKSGRMLPFGWGMQHAWKIREMSTIFCSVNLKAGDHFDEIRVD